MITPLSAGIVLAGLLLAFVGAAGSVYAGTVTGVSVGAGGDEDNGRRAGVDGDRGDGERGGQGGGGDAGRGRRGPLRTGRVGRRSRSGV